MIIKINIGNNNKLKNSIIGNNNLKENQNTFLSEIWKILSGIFIAIISAYIIFKIGIN